MKRVVVIGTSGSGKTTLSRALADRMGVPHVELDALYHGPGWTHVDDDDLARQVTDAVARDGWVVDGNYSKVAHIVWTAADAVIWLDYPRWLVMSRMVRRSLGRAIIGRELWHGNRERLPNLFKLDREDNTTLWSWTTHELNHRRYAAAFASTEWSDKILVRLRSPAETRRFLIGTSGS